MMISAIINGSPFVFWDTTHYLAFGRLIGSSDPSVTILTVKRPAAPRSPQSEEARRILVEKAASYFGVRLITYSVFLNTAISLAASRAHQRGCQLAFQRLTDR